MKHYNLLICLLPFLITTAQASQQDFNNKNNNEPENEYEQLEEGMAKYLPKFFDNNKTILEKLQEGKRKTIVVIGQTGAGKSALIGGLLGHNLVIKEEKVTKIRNGEKRTRTNKILVNTKLNGPKIGHSEVSSETTLPEAFLDQQTNLAFVDTAGLADTRNDGEAINLCNAIGLRKLIKTKSSVKCIIGVINYNNLNRGSNAFINLLGTINNLLKNKSPQKYTSSMVLAFTQVPSGITKDDVIDKLENISDSLNEKKENKQMKREDEMADTIFKVLFPSFYGGTNLLGININNTQDVPFFLVSKDDLLKGLVRKDMLPTLQKAQSINKKDIGLAIEPSLLQKAERWLSKRAKSVAKDIKVYEQVKEIKKFSKQRLSWSQTRLSLVKQRLQRLTGNSKNKSSVIKEVMMGIKETVETNKKMIIQLDKMIKEVKEQQKYNENEKNKKNTHDVELYKRLSYYSCGGYRYGYHYDENDVPIDHISYRGDTLYCIEVGDWLDKYTKVVSVDESYQEGYLKIIVKNTTKCSGCYKVGIYAEKKDIYHDRIIALTEDIDYLKKKLVDYENERNQRYKEIQDSLNQENLIENTKHAIRIKNEEIENIHNELPTLEDEYKLLDEKLKRHQDKKIFYIIINVASCIGFHDNQKHNINKCKEYYMNNVQKNNHNNNNEENTNSKHSDYQPGQFLSNNNNIQDDDEIKEDDSSLKSGVLLTVGRGNNNNIEDNQEERKEDDNNYNNNRNNWRSSSSLLSSIGLGTSILANTLSKKKN